MNKFIFRFLFNFRGFIDNVSFLRIKFNVVCNLGICKDFWVLCRLLLNDLWFGVFWGFILKDLIFVKGMLLFNLNI